MNFLEKTIATLSPKWAANRSRNRYVLNAYEAAQPSRTHKASRESKGANSTVRQSAVSLREQARALDQNHDIVIGILDKMEERVIGSKVFISNHSHSRLPVMFTKISQSKSASCGRNGR